MNIVQATHNGLRIKVTYKCGHVKTELSMTDAETKERRKQAATLKCHCCVSITKPQRITIDPISLQASAIRKAWKEQLENKSHSMRTR